MEALARFDFGKIKSIWDEKQDEILEKAFLCVLALYLFRLFMNGTTLGVNFPGWYEWLIRVLATGLGVLRLQRHPITKKFDLIFLLMSIVCCVLPYIKTGYSFLLDFPVFILGCNQIDYKKVLKVYLIVGTSVLAAAVYGTFIGVNEDLVYIRYTVNDGLAESLFTNMYAKLHLPVLEEGFWVRHSMGVMYCTDFAAWCFSLLLTMWFYFEGIPSFVFSGIFIVMSYLVYYLAGAKNTAAVLLAAAFAAFLSSILEWLKLVKGFCHIFNIFCGIISVLVTQICLVSVYYVLFFLEDEKSIAFINGLLSGRLWYSQEAINTYGISWLGNFFVMIGAGGSNQFTREIYNFVDISYVLMFVRYGIVFSVFLLFLLWVVEIKGSFVTNYRLPMAICLFAAHGLVEHHLVEPQYVILLVLPLALFENRSDRAKESIRKRILDWCYQFNVYMVEGGMVAGILYYAIHRVSMYRSLFLDSDTSKVTYLRLLFEIVALVWFGIASLKQKKRRWLAGIALPMAVFLLIHSTSNPQLVEEENIEELTDYGGIFQDLLDEKDTLGYSVYCDENSYYYESLFDDLDSCLFVENGMAGLENAVILTPRTQDRYVLNNNGFSYTAITEHYGIYTNSDAAIALLEKNGYVLSSVYNEVYQVDICDAEGNLGHYVVNGDNLPIYLGPIKITVGQRWRAIRTMLTLDMRESQISEESKFLRIAVVREYEKETLAKYDFSLDNVSEDGKVALDFGKYYDEDYYLKIEVLDDSVVIIDAVEYYKMY